MPNDPSKNKPPRFGPNFQAVVLWTALILLVLAAFVTGCLVRDPRVGLLFGIVLLFLVLLLLFAFHEDEAIEQQKTSRREHRKHLARKNEAANLEAQLQKPDFETRLRSYTQTERQDESESDPESKMEFWEREQEYSLTPTRPIELIRYLLQRIAKLVGQG